jgi:hypothetical protein
MMPQLVTVRVMVPDVWDEVALEVPASMAIASLKSTALERSGAGGSPDDFEAKFRGALLSDEGRSLHDVGMVAGSSIILVRRHRRPVR